MKIECEVSLGRIVADLTFEFASVFPLCVFRLVRIDPGGGRSRTRGRSRNRFDRRGHKSTTSSQWLFALNNLQCNWKFCDRLTNTIILVVWIRIGYYLPYFQAIEILYFSWELTVLDNGTARNKQWLPTKQFLWIRCWLIALKLKHLKQVCLLLETVI